MMKYELDFFTNLFFLFWIYLGYGDFMGKFGEWFQILREAAENDASCSQHLREAVDNSTEYFQRTFS